jgi:putative intracellular protease/amidase
MMPSGWRRRRSALTFRDDTALHALIAAFYESGKIVALICHGSSLLLWTRLSDGRLLAQGKKWTGFTDEEEAEVNRAFGMTLNDYTIESEAARIEGTNFLRCAANEPFAIRDGRLITGQQQYSSAITAELVLEALDEGDSAAETVAQPGGAATGGAALHRWQSCPR